MREEEVPVLIVGGGGAGLTASMLLARLGVEHLLVSSRPGTSDLPKAHVLNQRAMEVLEDVGVADAIAERSTPPRADGGHRLLRGLRRSRRGLRGGGSRGSSRGAGGADDNWRAASPWPQLNLPQIRLEPILKAGAERPRRGGSASTMSCSSSSGRRRRRARADATTAAARSTSCAANTCSARTADAASPAWSAWSTRAWAW